MVSYAAALRRRFYDYSTLKFSLMMTIGLVVLIYSISVGAMLDFAIDSISSDFWLLGVLVAASKSWWFLSLSGGEIKSRCVVLKASWHIFRIIVWKLPIFQQGQHSCRPAWTWELHAYLSNSLLHYHTNYWASTLDHHILAGRTQSHMPLVWKTGCGDFKGCSISSIQTGWYRHHIIALEDWGDKRNTRRQNGPWI